MMAVVVRCEVLGVGEGEGGWGWGDIIDQVGCMWDWVE